MPIERATLTMHMALIAKESASWAHEGAIMGALGKREPVRNSVARRYCDKIKEMLNDIESDLKSEPTR